MGLGGITVVGLVDVHLCINLWFYHSMRCDVAVGEPMAILSGVATFPVRTLLVLLTEHDFLYGQ